MNKPKFETQDLTQENINKIGALFPNCVTEAKDEKGNFKKVVNFEMLKQVLTPEALEGDESYEFTWVGKKAAIVEANKPIRKTLRPCKEESVNWDTTENLYIEGDNLEVLKLLQESYLGKVKMIYIDPPYNTGHDFVYPDSFIMDNDDFNEGTGYFDEDGNVNFSRENSTTAGKYHSDWCSMIYSRLLLARNLLSDDGLIFISIDDNEVENLKKICDEVFGEDNFINIISLFTKVSAGASGGGEDRKLKKNMEYVLFYAKKATELGALPPIYKKTLLTDYIQQMKKENKSFKYINVLYKIGEKEYFKTIKDGSGGDIKIYKINDYEIKTVKQISKEENISEEEVYSKYYNRIMTTTNAQTSIRDRVWEATDSENNMYIANYVPSSGKNKGNPIDLIFMGKQKVLVIWLKDTAEIENGIIYKKEKIGTYWDGFSWINVTKEGNIRFENGKKPIALIQQLMQLIPNKKEGIILDFFSGSASTAHAVLQENFITNNKYKFILVQLKEEILPTTKENKEYLKYLKEEKILPFVSEIGKERIRRAGKKIKEENPETTKEFDIGFRVLKIDESNMKDVYYAASEYDQKNLDGLESNIKEDRNDLDLLFGCLLDWGLPLSLPYTSEIVGKYTIHTYNEGDLVACFNEDVSEDVVKEIARKKPLRAVFRDSSFSNSASKINVFEIFKMISPETSVKVI